MIVKQSVTRQSSLTNPFQSCASNITVVYARAHDGQSRQIEKPSQEIRKGVARESEEENLAAGIEVESPHSDS